MPADVREWVKSCKSQMEHMFSAFTLIATEPLNRGHRCTSQMCPQAVIGYSSAHASAGLLSDPAIRSPSGNSFALDRGEIVKLGSISRGEDVRARPRFPSSHQFDFQEIYCFLASDIRTETHAHHVTSTLNIESRHLLSDCTSSFFVFVRRLDRTR